MQKIEIMKFKRKFIVKDGFCRLKNLFLFFLEIDDFSMKIMEELDEILMEIILTFF